jgi:hypothetical protein
MACCLEGKVWSSSRMMVFIHYLYIGASNDDHRVCMIHSIQISVYMFTTSKQARRYKPEYISRVTNASVTDENADLRARIGYISNAIVVRRVK